MDYLHFTFLNFRITNPNEMSSIMFYELKSRYKGKKE